MDYCSVIFDFDDTLVCTNEIYDAAREELFVLMENAGCTQRNHWGEYLNNADIAQVHLRGRLACECFPLAMRQTCAHFARLSAIEPDKALLDEAENIGWRVFDIVPEPVDGAADLLQELQGQARLFLLTEGDERVQKPRLLRYTHLHLFEKYHIVQVKDERAYQQLLHEHQLHPENTWMVGNSVRADINPALRVGLNAAHFTKSAWDFRPEDPVLAAQTISNLYDFLPLFEQSQQCQKGLINSVQSSI